jgi:hypothetical protein
MKSCATCRFHDDDLEIGRDHCRHPAGVTHDRIRGSLIPSVKLASSEAGSCGPNAKLWEPQRSFGQKFLASVFGNHRA